MYGGAGVIKYSVGKSKGIKVIYVSRKTDEIYVFVCSFGGGWGRRLLDFMLSLAPYYSMNMYICFVKNIYNSTNIKQTSLKWVILL